MNRLNDISDDEFVPFLHSLGVETYNKSFEWMFHDPAIAEILKWLYNNLDHNNALTASEECRYLELKKINNLLPSEELEKCVTYYQQEFEGICLPGDQDSLDDMKLSISMDEERLAMLKNHEEIMNGLIKQNKSIKEALDVELMKLSASQKQHEEEERVLGDQCVVLVKEIDAVVDDVCHVIRDNLKMCTSADKVNPSKFFAFGPFETYRQIQSHFKSHFDLFVSKAFVNKQMYKINDEELNTVLTEARVLETSLSDAVHAYISSKAELSGQQAQSNLVSNYIDFYPTQSRSSILEAQNSVEILEQEENILNIQIKDAVKEFVASRTNLAKRTAASIALNIREKINNDLAFLLKTTYEALAVDKLLYYMLRNELRSLGDLLHFATHLRQYLLKENEAVRSRIKSMNAICTEQALVKKKLQSSNILLTTLYTLLGAEPSNDPLLVLKLHSQLKNDIKKLKDDVEEAYEKKEMAIATCKQSSIPLKEYIWDGCTKRPYCYVSTAGSLSYQLKREIEKVDKKVLEARDKFASVKNGDKQGLRKLWQWFLTDQAKLLSAVKSSQSSGYI
ncbi:putative leucine-rich repeat-containing protein DDB_G0290503 [Battus philenor]|uniref:putative leucine-rich repeat-containing protein DDB_G0290503 n=1 Tax=Battus philenor TaxID=42288 RepID=UPI0035D09EB8